MDYTFVTVFLVFIYWGGVSSQYFYCDFEASSTCGFTQSTSDQFDWTLKSGHTGSSSTGPDYDHTRGTTAGHYLYTEASGPRNVSDRAVLLSPYQVQTEESCLQFWYHMYGSGMGTLTVYLQGSNRSNIFHMSGDQGNVWRLSRHVIRSPTSSWRVEFEGVRGTDFQSDVAIDDVSITPCSCTFDRDLCNWSNVAGDEFNWLRRTGSTPSSFTGPSIDHTQGDSSGGFLYIEMSSGERGDKAWLDSPLFPAFTSDTICFSFWFHMYGSDIGTLNVYIVDTTATRQTILWSQYGSKGDNWISSQIQISPQSEQFKIRFEGVRGPGVRGDIALDDVSFISPSQCKHTHCRPGRYGSQCTSSCRSNNCRNNQCDRSSGYCAACPDNFTGSTCSECSPGNYGPNCQTSCPSDHCRNNQCDKTTGQCAACTDNFSGSTCSDCLPGQFGADCSVSCLSSNCMNNECHRSTGRCLSCPVYFEGDLCNDCTPGRYGSNCSSVCLRATCRENRCNRTTGFCEACPGNLFGEDCSALPATKDWTWPIVGTGVAVGVLLMICLTVCLCCFYRSKASSMKTTVPDIPLSEAEEPTPAIRFPAPGVAENYDSVEAGLTAGEPDRVYEKIRDNNGIGADGNSYTDFPSPHAQATAPVECENVYANESSPYVNLGFS